MTVTPSGAVWSYLPIHLPASASVRDVALHVRERDVIEVPEQLSRNSFPRLNVLNTKFLYELNLFAATNTDILIVLLELTKEKHLTKPR